MRDDFGKTEMNGHRAELIQRLNCALGELNPGLGHLKQHDPQLEDYDLKKMKYQYGKLKEALSEAETRTSSQSVPLLDANLWMSVESHSTFTGSA